MTKRVKKKSLSFPLQNNSLPLSLSPPVFTNKIPIFSFSQPFFPFHKIKKPKWAAFYLIIIIIIIVV